MFKVVHRLRTTIGRGDRGFTLVELLIVVAIIGILDAIAIPQFSVYRTRSYNATALSDLRNIRTSEENLFADNGSYAPAALSPGNLLLTFDGSTVGTFAVSKNVRMGVTTFAAAPTATVTATTYAITSKSDAGDRTFCGESEQSAMLYNTTLGIGTPLTTLVVATNGNDCTGTAL